MVRTSKVRWAVRLVTLLAVGLLLAALVIFKTPVLLSDIRPASLGSEPEGRATLDALQRAHGGARSWRNHEWVELRFEGLVPFPPARMIFGTPEQFDLVLRYDPRVHGRAAVTLDGVTHEVTTQDGNDGLALVADAVRHLWEMPFAMQSADVVHALPDESGHTRMLATWGTSEPQTDVDQYILWSEGGSCGASTRRAA